MSGHTRKQDGYRVLSAGKSALVLEHVAVAERAIGGPLPPGAQVHHVDENPANNDPSNLVICPSQEYHLLLHVRQRAMDATGDPNKRKCKFCQRYDETKNMAARKGRASNPHYVHLSCECASRNERRTRAKEQACQQPL